MKNMGNLLVLFMLMGGFVWLGVSCTNESDESDILDGTSNDQTSLNKEWALDEVKAVPIISPDSAISYTESVSVSIRSSNSDDIIYFTLDGTTPNENSLEYTNTITLIESTIVNARSYNYSDKIYSKTASKSYTILTEKAAAPIFTPSNSAPYLNSIEVTISCSTDRSKIFYTTNENDPTQYSNQYTSPITVSATTTIKAIAYKYDQYDQIASLPSDIVTMEYIFQASEPSFNPVAGTYSGQQVITISTTTTDAAIYYTIDESDPSSSHYESYCYDDCNITVSKSKVIKAIAIKNQMENSNIVAAEYIIQYQVQNITFEETRGVPQLEIPIGGQNQMELNWKTGSYITLEWDSISGVDSYHVYRSTSYSGTYDVIGSGSDISCSSGSCSFSDYDMDILTTYYYKIVIVIDGEEVALSDPYQTQVSSKGFNIFRGSNYSGVDDYVQTNPDIITNNQFIELGLPSSRDYYYAVTEIYADDSESSKSISEERNGTTLPRHSTSLNVSFKADYLYLQGLDIWVVVYDQAGDVVNNLDLSNFSIQEDGVAKTINTTYSNYLNLDNYYEYGGAFTMDYSGSMSSSDIRLMELLISGIAQNKRDSDKFEIVKFSDAVNVVVPFTQDKTVLKNGIFASYASGSTALYDSIYQSILDTVIIYPISPNSYHREFVVAFTDGAENASSHSKTETIAYAQSMRMPIFTVGYGSTPDPSLQEIADQTGGAMVTGNSNTTGLYEKVAMLTEYCYNIIFDSSMSGTHNVTVTVIENGLSGSITIPINYSF